MNLDIGLPVERLMTSVRASMTGQAREPQHHVLHAVNRRGRPVECTITITPLVLDGERSTGAILLIEARATGEAPTAHPDVASS
jgi:two-component system CheB/CheR fusion protein